MLSHSGWPVFCGLWPVTRESQERDLPLVNTRLGKYRSFGYWGLGAIKGPGSGNVKMA
jgi:hypothetical protein